MSPDRRSDSKRPWLLVAFGAIVAVFLVELTVRIATDSVFRWRSSEGNDNVDIDPQIGRIPKPGLSIRHPQGFKINIGDYGTRRNGDEPPPAERPLILVVGDSFAFGDGVDDEDSWPAALERMIGQRVINAAVPGFGLDQMVLRAEQLAEVYSPDTIIVSFIPHDVNRCEMSFWSGHPKPYFDIEGGVLRLHPAIEPRPSRLTALKRWLASSMALELLFPRFLHWEGPEATTAHQQGAEVACLLMRRLAELERATQARVVVLAQPQQATATREQLEVKNNLLACARESGLQTVDLFPTIGRLPLEDRTPLFPRHMSSEGNQLVAAELADLLKPARRRSVH